MKAILFLILIFLFDSPWGRRERKKRRWVKPDFRDYVRGIGAEGQEHSMSTRISRSDMGATGKPNRNQDCDDILREVERTMNMSNKPLSAVIREKL